MQGNLTALLITAGIILTVVCIGFIAGSNKQSRKSVEEWSVGGRRFGGLLVWFLVGADLYTAYTFLGLTSTAFTSGSVAFFAIPYSVLAYFIAYFFLPKIWKVAKVHQLTTLADYARERFSSKLLSSLVAIVGVLMLIPYICLQLSGIQDTLQIAGTGFINVNVVVIISFVLVALYTFFSGIKGPTYTAIIKDILVWVMMLFMVVSLPLIHFNGWTPMIDKLANEAPHMLTIPSDGPRGIAWFITASIVSAFALFMWAHAATGVFTANSADALRKNSMFLPLYNIVLILVIFLGFIAFLVLPDDINPRFALLYLIQSSYGGVTQGFAYSTIALASLIPCSIMAIGASNLFANNLYRDLINHRSGPFIRNAVPGSACNASAARCIRHGADIPCHRHQPVLEKPDEGSDDHRSSHRPGRYIYRLFNRCHFRHLRRLLGAYRQPFDRCLVESVFCEKCKTQFCDQLFVPC